MSKEALPIPSEIEPLIHTVRDQKVILDSDLAAIYGVPTYRFNEAVKRNRGQRGTPFVSHYHALCNGQIRG